MRPPVLGAGGPYLLGPKIAVADVGECVVQEHMFGTGRWGVTAPDQRIEATLRVAPGGPVERATYPPGPGHRNRWPVRHRGGRMRRRILTGDRTTSGIPGPQDRSAGRGVLVSSAPSLRNGPSRLAERSIPTRERLRRLRGAGLWPPIVPAVVLAEALRGTLDGTSSRSGFSRCARCTPPTRSLLVVPVDCGRGLAEAQRLKRRGYPEVKVGSLSRAYARSTPNLGPGPAPSPRSGAVLPPSNKPC
jgi:hypothetical protein